jgi:S-adenosylmethionine-dependent methyltransferase
MAKQAADQDRNFDGLAERFNKNVYGGLKGRIRLAVLERDFQHHFEFVLTPPQGAKPLRILDAGGGQGHFSLSLARAGHQLVICDISADMLAQARTQAEREGLLDSVTFLQCAIQDLPVHLEQSEFDVVLCHAVIEWLAQPQALLPCLYRYLKPGGQLSFTYYNRRALVYKNLLRGNFNKIIDNDFGGARGSLTPIHPMEPAVIEQWLQEVGFIPIGSSGIRVFHDYIFDAQVRERDPENLLALELALSQQEPYRLLGRYIHVMAQKPQSLTVAHSG